MAGLESQLVISVVETRSESTAQQQQPQQQQQFNTEVVVACRDKVELETRGEEQEELLQLPLKQQQQLQPRAAPPHVWTSQLVFPHLETGSESTAQQQPRGQQEQFETEEKRWLGDWVVKLNTSSICRAPWERWMLSPLMCRPGLGSAQGGWLWWGTLRVKNLSPMS